MAQAPIQRLVLRGGGRKNRDEDEDEDEVSFAAQRHSVCTFLCCGVSSPGLLCCDVVKSIQFLQEEGSGSDEDEEDKDSEEVCRIF